MEDVRGGRGFTVYDYAIFGVNLALCVAIGVYHACTRPSTNTDGTSGGGGSESGTTEGGVAGAAGPTREFLTAGGRLRVLPLTVSLGVSVVSAVTLLGLPAEMYRFGSQYALNVGSGLGIVLTAFILVPLLHPLRLTSMFEYLEKRYNSRVVRLSGSLLGITSMLLYGGTALFAPATALEGVTQVSAWSLALAMGCLVTFYTALGGMRAVVWTDMLQAIIMLSGVIVVMVQGCLKVGGLGNVWRANEAGGRIQGYNFDPDPRTRHTFWGLTVGFAMGGFSFYGASQFTFQRFTATKTVQQAKMTVLLNLPVFYLFHVLLCGVGLVIYAYYHHADCDPLASGAIRSSNQLLPLFVMDTLGHAPGLPGLFVAALTSGALSTVSSLLNSVAALVWEDLLKTRLHFLTDVQATWVIKCIVVVCGMIIVGLSFLANNFGAHVFQVCFAFLGATGGPQLGMFLLGALFPNANSKGVVVGCLAGIAMTSWITVGSYVTKPVSPTLPPAPTSGCYGNLASNSSALISSVVTLAYMNVTSSTAIPVERSSSGISELYRVSYTWNTTVGAATCILVGLIASWLTGGEATDLQDSPYVLPLYAKLRRCFFRQQPTKDNYIQVYMAPSDSKENPSKEEEAVV